MFMAEGRFRSPSTVWTPCTLNYLASGGNTPFSSDANPFDLCRWTMNYCQNETRRQTGNGRDNNSQHYTLYCTHTTFVALFYCTYLLPSVARGFVLRLGHETERIHCESRYSNSDQNEIFFDSSNGSVRRRFCLVANDGLWTVDDSSSTRDHADRCFGGSVPNNCGGGFRGASGE